jgi:hypothetical protein
MWGNSSEIGDEQMSIMSGVSIVSGNADLMRQKELLHKIEQEKEMIRYQLQMNQKVMSDRMSEIA